MRTEQLGLLWAEYDDKPLVKIVNEVRRRYKRKFAVYPTLITANKADVPEEIVVRGITVKPMPNMLRYHYYATLD